MSDALVFRMQEHDAVVSTNNEIKQALEAGEPEGLVVRAHRQLGGYGRLGRTWASPEGGLYLSLLLRPAVATAVLPTLSLVVGLAVRNALAELLPLDSTQNVRLKWPNDVVVTVPADAAAVVASEASPASLGTQPASELPYRKLCGISLETHAGGVCVGIGVNVERPHDVSLDEVGGKNTPAYLAEMGFSGTIDKVAHAVLDAFAREYPRWLNQGFAPFVAEYARYDALAGRAVRMINQADRIVAQGAVVSVDEEGRLVLRTSEGDTVAISSGEAHLV